MYFQILVGQIPLLLVFLVCLGVTILRWKHTGGAAAWAAGAFALALLLTVVQPAVQLGVQSWAMEAGVSNATPMFAAVGIISSGLHALVYVGLLIGVLVGRAAPAPARA